MLLHSIKLIMPSGSHRRAAHAAADRIAGFAGSGFGNNHVFTFAEAGFHFGVHIVAQAGGDFFFLRLVIFTEHAHILLAAALLNGQFGHRQHFFGLIDDDGVFRGHADMQHIIFIGHERAGIVINRRIGGVGAGGVAALRHSG